jgi:cellobiose phosphorylase
MKSSFGYFANDGKEFVVTQANTPRALVNYFWNPVFISGVSQHGGGEGVYKERAIQYIDPRDRNLMVRDCHRYFYMRDEGNDEVWSPGWHPVQRELDRFECRHGLGYSIISSALNGIETTMRVFVPAKDPCEIWTVTIRNVRSEAAQLRLYTFVDWLLRGYPRYCDYYGYLLGEYYEDLHAVQGCNRAAERTHEVYDGFVASDIAPSGFDTSRSAFLGNFGHVHMPEAIRNGGCTNSKASCEKLVSAMEHKLTLAPGESTTLQILIGASSGYEMTRDIVHNLTAPGVVEKEFADLLERKREMVDKVRVHTPDERVNYLINGWIKQQTQVYADVGSDNGRGFRDAIQLLWATSSYDQDYSRRMLIECLSHQFADGHTLRGWLPIDDHHYSDGPLWIPPVIDAYLRETGDYEMLDLVVPFFDEGEGTVWEHLLRAMRHSSEDVGEHGLVHAHFGDWNDSLTGVGVEGKGETVWGSIALIYGLKIAARIADKVRKNADEASELLARAEKMTAMVNEHAWDGKWYLRAINDHGQEIGTHTEKEGWIYLLPQVWAILADIVDEDRRKQLYDVIDRYLDTDCGCKTLHPAYTEANMAIGRITYLVPGVWENGTPYCHANGFKIIADCKGGRADQAYASFCKALPDSEWNPSTHSGSEPYVLTNQYLGPDNRRAGKTLWSWMTGSASWYYRALIEYMIGVSAEYDGLKIDPCLPSEWPDCSVERDFRGARYHIDVHNPDRIGKGRTSITVDGETLDGNVVPDFGDGKLHAVDVTILPAD